MVSTRSNNRGGLIKFGKILYKKEVDLFLSQTPVKVVPNKVKWVVKFVKKWNLRPNVNCFSLLLTSYFLLLSRY